MVRLHPTLRGVLFDLDGTLYDYTRSNEIANRALFSFLSRTFRRPLRDVRRALIRARASVHRDLHGTAASHSRLLYIRKMIELLGYAPMPLLELRAHELFSKKFLSASRPRAGTRDLFRALRKKGVKIAIVSDLLTDVQLRKLIHLKLHKYLDAIVTSEEVGAEKPAPRIFERALEKLRLGPRDVAVVGDDFIKDGSGAWRVGIRRVYLVGVRAPKKHGIIRVEGIRELRPHLLSLCR